MDTISKENAPMACQGNAPGPEGSNDTLDSRCWRGAGVRGNRGYLTGRPDRTGCVWLLIGMNSKIIQDPVHGPIRASDAILEMIDTPEFQRLRYIKNLGLCYLVFPSANHSRFEHSIGTFHLAGMYLDHLGIKSEETAMAALLHDVGHFPFSHTIEDFYRKNRGVDHLEEGIKIIRGERESNIPSILEKYSIDVKKVVSILEGRENVLSEIVSGPIDADELDYLRRDSFYCGVSIGFVNPARVISVSGIYDGRMIIEEKGLSDIESLLISRFLMYQAVYFHKTCRIANRMLERAAIMSEAYDTYRLSDQEFTHLLMSDPRSEDMMRNILDRRLMKVLYKVKYDESLAHDILNAVSEKFIVDIIPPLSFRGKDRLKTQVGVLLENRIATGEESSPLVNALNSAIDRRYIYVYGYHEDERDLKRDLAGI
ncbi:IFN-gamma-induced (putative GTP-binding protein) protein Mg11 related protein [Thermoplasma acidophilum]|uniref:IFN-gamma-induced (Putative GTP-binding protein) protein Mg11 related protein n=2 Tax=Thermoplasma acidophilum TaxID=2303 RepID=Q9HLN4_THEAC|nr:IFN-gamma-induced (putative GTP-binding protein) protein Mg11 related protein [Thermoplasma acidophilum]